MEVQKVRMLIIIMQMFAIFGGTGEEIDSNILPTSSEDGTINFDKMSREELITFILSQQRTTNEPVTYKKMEYSNFCSGSWARITSEATCKAAAAALGLKWAQSWYGNGDFPGCLHTKDYRNRVYFNTSPNPSNNPNINANYAEICQAKAQAEISTTTPAGPPACPSTPAGTCPPLPVCLTTPLTPTCPPPPLCPPTPLAPTCPPTPVCPPTSVPSTCPPPTVCPLASSQSTYSTTPEGVTESPVQATTIILDGCYQNFNLSNREGKIINTPGFLVKQNYSNNLNCKWTFRAPHGEKVSMTLLHMDTEYGYDVIRVLDGISEEDDKLPILATMSGNEKLEAVISSSPQMTITFTSDINVNMTGFQANVAALKKADLPQFVWIDLLTLNITYPTGENEIISLTRGAEGEHICIFQGATSETSVIITSPSSTNDCKSLDQFIEIMVRSKFMEDKKRIYTMRNGRLQQIDINVFGNNELIRKKDILLKKKNAEQIIPTKIRIPIQFAFDKTLVKKFSKYEHEKSYIQKRLLEIFNGVKLNLKNILHKTDVEFTLEKRIIYINKELKVNDTTLMESRKYQLHEDIPLVIFCAEDHHSNIKGLTFRSGACRKNKEQFGVIMLTWRDDGSLAADVLEHELGHLIGGVHNQKIGTETHVGHTDFNSDNINLWFTSAGDRCYGKNCSSPPDIPHGSWSCDTELYSCDMTCDWGFSIVSTLSSAIIECQNGNWSQNIHDLACFPSVFLVAGGWDAEKDVEMFHPEVGNLNCTNKPPALTQEWIRHTTFAHRGTLYLCGGFYTSRLCISYKDGNTWSTHSLQQQREWGHSSVVMGQTIFLIGGDSNTGYPGVEQSRLPFLMETPTWSPVPNMPYKGQFQCSVKVDSNSFVVTGGSKDYVYFNTVSKYNVVEETTEALAPLIHARAKHGCLVLQENGTTWIIVTAGKKRNNGIKSTEILNLSDSRNAWIFIGDLNEGRRGHGMALTVKGPIVVAGRDNNGNELKSIEVLNWQTNTWTQFEQSLNTGRSYYGGVIEIPSHLNRLKTGCSDIPPKENGIWSCDSNKTSCWLICDPGFSSAYTTTTCTGGLWKEINKMECTESVFIIVGGHVSSGNVEIFHPEVPNIKCSSPPPSIGLKRYIHTSFTHQGTIYLCGGWETPGSCTTYSYNDNTWSMHTLQEHRKIGHSSVVVGDTLFLIGGVSTTDYEEVVQSRLPFLTDTPTWSPVPNMPYKGMYQCSVKTGVNSFVVTGGEGAGAINKVTRYNIKDETADALAPLLQPRSQHGCLVKQENGETWIIVTAGWNEAAGGTLKSTEILNLSNSGNAWTSSGDLNVARQVHGMALTIKGPIVVGGWDNNKAGQLKSIEVQNWQTKEWRQFEQSLTTGRNFYGGVIELPGHLFGCQTQPVAITGCTGEYKHNEEFIGGVNTPVGQDQTCHSLCQNNDDCLGWTWTQVKQCRIITQQSALDSLHSKTGSISGVKNACKPKCYLVLSENEEASTNTQFCIDENTETDCVNMIHLEPDEFQPGDNGHIKICYHDEDEGRGYCEDVDYENVDLLCNPDPGIVTLSTFQKINKYTYVGHNKPYFGYGIK